MTKNMFKESDLARVEKMGWRERIPAAAALSREEPIPNNNQPSSFGAISPFGNTPSFGNGGFPDFNQWLQMRYNPTPVFQPKPASPLSGNTDWNRIFNPEPKIKMNDKNRRGLADLFGVTPESVEEVLKQVNKRPTTIA